MQEKKPGWQTCWCCCCCDRIEIHKVFLNLVFVYSYNYQPVRPARPPLNLHPLSLPASLWRLSFFFSLCSLGKFTAYCAVKL